MATGTVRGKTQFKIIRMKSGEIAFCDRAKLPAQKGRGWADSDIRAAATGGVFRSEYKMQIKRAKGLGDYVYIPDMDAKLYPVAPRE